MDFSSGGPQSENQIKRKERQVLTPCRRTKKAVDPTVAVIRIVIGVSVKVLQALIRAVGRIRNQRTSRDFPIDSTDEICQNTEKSSGDLRRLAGTHTPVKTISWCKYLARSNILIIVVNCR